MNEKNSCYAREAHAQSFLAPLSRFSCSPLALFIAAEAIGLKQAERGEDGNMRERKGAMRN